MVFGLLENTFAGQKIKSSHFYFYSPGQNSPPGSYCHFQAAFFRRPISPNRKEGENYDAVRCK